MKTDYKPRYDLVLVEKLKEEKIVSGVILPMGQNSLIGSSLIRLKVIECGPDVKDSDLLSGKIVLAEDMFQAIKGEIGLINQKFIHCIEEN